MRTATVTEEEKDNLRLSLEYPVLILKLDYLGFLP